MLVSPLCAAAEVVVGRKNDLFLYFLVMERPLSSFLLDKCLFPQMRVCLGV